MIKFLATVAATALASSYAFAPPSYPSAQRHQLVLSAVATNIKGTVKWYNAQRGFGFIEVDDGGPDMYVHATGLTFQGPLIDGERLSFDTEIDPRTNKPKAVAVERVADEEAVAKPEPVSAKEAQVEEAPAEDTPIATAITRTVFDVPKKEKLHVASPPNETFQRSLLAASLANRSGSSNPASATLIQSVDYDATARLAYNAAGGSGDFEDFKTKYLEDASAMVAEKHKAASAEAVAAAEAKEAAAKAEAEAARVAKEAEEKRLAEEAAAKEAAAKAAEEARLAKEAEQAQDAKARELGYPSAAVMKARSQPKSPEDEAALAARYGAMDLEERAFSILADLGMIELHLDPDDPSRDTSHDDDDME